ncbi:chemotaxis protein CheW [Noviherbaspirillum suwonense]|uniref:CheW-like domain-containing protein n=1 Tax=Noviherbaspirillum suwonense TaxID=1224511 RepID=A0ABY1QW01_9BURK|nr:CheW-like domain-containing protein [Noviherbaspirillum suwonense]
MQTDLPLTYPCEVLNFRLGGEEYGIGIMNVQKLRPYENVIRIANAPDTAGFQLRTVTFQ